MGPLHPGRRFATRTLASTALESVRKAGLEPDDVSLFIPHQANIRIIEAVAKGLNLPMDRMFVNLDRYGNTSAPKATIQWTADPARGLARAAAPRGAAGFGPPRPRRPWPSSWPAIRSTSRSTTSFRASPSPPGGRSTHD